MIPECNPILWVWMKDMTMSSSYMAFHQNWNVFEDWVWKKTYSTKKYLEVIYWLKLLYYGLEWLKYVQKFIFYYDYPKFSKYCMFIFLIAAYFAETSHFASYALLILIFSVIGYSEPF